MEHGLDRLLEAPLEWLLEASLELVVGAATLNALCELLTEAIFDLPKTAALDDAYKFLGLDHKATNDQINKRYRQLALIYHPDKEGGSEDKFIKLHSYVCIIRASRE